MNQKQHDALETIIAEVKKEVARENFEKGYKKGSNEAWHCSQGIVYMTTNMDGAVLLEKFFGKASLTHIFENYTAAEVIEKFNENIYDHIELLPVIPKVGDEIEKEDGQIGVIVDVNDIAEKANVLWASGNVTHALGFKRFKLTGRNFKEVVELLDKMVIGEAEE